MSIILLQPTDVLFFRDGRPMSGSLTGHGAAWPLPNVINAAFHAALHRGFVDQPHIGTRHAPARRENGQRVYAAKGERDRRFVDVWSAGPFPVDKDGNWYFPRPSDAQENGTVRITLKPFWDDATRDRSSLSAPLRYAMANTEPPKKETGAKAWLSKAAYGRYLADSDSSLNDNESLNDCDFADTEHTIGIAIDPTTGTTGQGEAAGKIYSAHYLRLRDGFRLGTAAGDGVNAQSRALDALFAEEQRIIVGGQQRVCTVELRRMEPLPLPVAGNSFVKDSVTGKYLVKWVLLTPAIWPEIPAIRDGHPILDRNGSPIIAHHGGWLPNWVDLEGKVRLKAIDHQRPNGMHRKAWRDLLQQSPEIQARLVAALVPKPIPVTGWALDPPSEIPNTDSQIRGGGAKSTHLAVPAGAVYYFEADSPEEAGKLAGALNWHGNEINANTIKNRRSTLLGEKGFGLGVCGTWEFYEESKTQEKR